MALWKPFRGSRAVLDAVEKHDGYVYFCVDDGSLFFDYIDADGVLQRKQINAKDAETLMGTSLDTIKSGIGTVATKAAANESAITAIKDGTTIDSFADVETALASKQPDWNENDETSPAYVKNRTHYVKRTFLDATMQNYESIHGWKLDSITFLIDGTMYYDIPTEDVGNFTYEYNAGDYTISVNMRTYAFTITPEAEFKIVQEEYTTLHKKYLPDENFNIINGVSKTEEKDFTAGAIKTIGCKTEYQPGANSFAQGANCQAYGPNSTANGVECITRSTANWSHAEGRMTIAGSQYQHVSGSCNIEDTSGLLEIVGNGGGASARSNAYTLDRSGNAWYSGDVYVGSTSGTNKDSGSVKLAREDEVLLLDSQTLTEDQKTQVRTNIGAVEPKLITTISLSASSWTGTTSPYSQVVSVSGVTANSQVDFQPTAVQLATLQDLGISLMTENDGGIVTVYALNNKPTSDYTIQATITEVKGAGS